MRKKRFRRIAASILTAAMLLQQVPVTALAEEPAAVAETLQEDTSQPEAKAAEASAEKAAEASAEKPTEAPTEKPTEAPTEKPTEAPTEAPTEKPTEAPTETPTEKPTEAPTEAPTEKPTEAPTEKPTETPTEAPTEKPTEGQTQTPTEEQTQAPTESQTEALTEDSTEALTEEESETEADTKKEPQTERAERANDGKKISASTLTSSLKAVLPYLFAAKSVSLPERFELEDEAKETEKKSEKDREETESASERVILPSKWILDGAEGGAKTGGLSDFSVMLANGRSTSGVKVINLYADKKGKLDTRQLKEAFSDQTLDVTSQYVVVNVIAAKKNQALTFSDYNLKKNGQSVIYQEADQAGEVLYNFAYFDGKKFLPFQGSVALSSGDGLQGTFLAPEAEVSVQSDLAGAVYAESIHAADSVKDLIRIALIEGVQEETLPEAEETETDTEAASEGVTETLPESEETEIDTEAASEGVTETLPESEETETDTEAASEGATETLPEAEETETDTEAASEGVTETLPETEETKPEETETESEAVTEPEDFIMESEVVEELPPGSNETETGMETEETEPEEILVDTEELLLARSLMWHSEQGVRLELRLRDADQPGVTLSGAEAAVYAAGPVLGEDGTVVFEKNSEVVRAGAEGGTLALNLQYGGSYYLQLTKVPQDAAGVQYLRPSRIYFQVNAEGQLVISGNGQYVWENQVLMIPLQKQAQASIELVDAESGAQLAGAVFVLKDASGKLLCSADGPLYYITYEGAPEALYGLEAGTYFLSELQAPEGYQVAEDVKFEISLSAGPVRVKMSNTKAAGAKSLQLTGRNRFGATVLTAERPQESFAALFSDPELTRRVSEVKSLAWAAGSTESAAAVFEGLADGTYYVGVTDEFGGQPENPPYHLELDGQEHTEVTFAPADSENARSAVLETVYTTYPEDGFSYEAEIQITKEVKNRDGSARTSADTFYAMLYEDAECTVKALDAPATLAMNNRTEASVTVKLKMTSASRTFYLAETDADGNKIQPDAEFAYGITYPDGQAVTANYEGVAKIRIRNQINDTVVKLRLEEASSQKLLGGAKLIVKDRKTGKAVTEAFVSGKKELVWKNRLGAGEYLLTEVTAPEGYANTEDVSFTVEDGRTTEVVMKNEPVTVSEYQLTAVKQVYSGGNQLYAQDPTGIYAKEGRYTFYAALFSDAKRTKKVSDVQKITVSALGGTTVFKNLKKAGTYYLAETDEYGTVRRSTASCKVTYSDAGKVRMTAKTRQSVIQNDYAELPRGYRHTAVLTLTKKLVSASGEPDSTTKTFYAGIYRKADFSDKPTIVPLKLENSSAASARRRILLAGTKSATYYIAEVDANGNRITDEGAFGYNISIDQPEVTLNGGDEKNVTITNKTRVSKVTLYLTKKVYNGTKQKKVNETFYAGLFKDPQFTQLYTKPIPIQLKNQSELTLKLSLNLGSASEAKIYIAEVDKDGKVIKPGKEFGYDIRVVNAAAEFTQERTEIQTILLNAVYDSVSGSDWNEIFNQDGNNSWIGGGSGGGWGSNGGGGAGMNGSVETGDETPIVRYAVIFAVSLLAVLGAAALMIRSKRKRR